MPKLDREQVLAEFPTSWLDPLLTGPDAVIPQDRPASNDHIQKLLMAVRARIIALPVIE